MQKNTFYKKMDNIRKAAITTTAKVISAPAVIKSKLSQSKSDADFKILRDEKNMKGMPDFDSNGVTDAFKTRSVAQGVKARLSKKK